MTLSLITPFKDATVVTPSNDEATASPIIITVLAADVNNDNTFEALFEKEVAFREDAITAVLDDIISAKDSIKTSIDDLKAALVEANDQLDTFKD